MLCPPPPPSRSKAPQSNASVTCFRAAQVASHASRMDPSAVRRVLQLGAGRRPITRPSRRSVAQRQVRYICNNWQMHSRVERPCVSKLDPYRPERPAIVAHGLLRECEQLLASFDLVRAAFVQRFPQSACDPSEQPQTLRLAESVRQRERQRACQGCHQLIP